MQPKEDQSALGDSMLDMLRMVPFLDRITPFRPPDSAETSILTDPKRRKLMEKICQRRRPDRQYDRIWIERGKLGQLRSRRQESADLPGFPRIRGAASVSRPRRQNGRMRTFSASRAVPVLFEIGYIVQSNSARSESAG